MANTGEAARRPADDDDDVVTDLTDATAASTPSTVPLRHLRPAQQVRHHVVVGGREPPAFPCLDFCLSDAPCRNRRTTETGEPTLGWKEGSGAIPEWLLTERCEIWGRGPSVCVLKFDSPLLEDHRVNTLSTADRQSSPPLQTWRRLRLDPRHQCLPEATYNDNPLVDVRTDAGYADVRLGGLWNRHVWKEDTRARAGRFTKY
jgi:hypothetical protein